jgi:predicted RecB family nuclease
MIGTWAAAAEAHATGAPLSAHPLMVEIADYNEVDCRAMAEVVTWLRQNRQDREGS